ncbi:hypothetical protein AALA83_06540 [Oscillospiraceae bacterium 44-5]
MDKGERKLTEKELKRMENGGLKPPIFENTYAAHIGRIIFARKHIRIENDWASLQKKTMRGLEKVFRKMGLVCLKHNRNWQTFWELKKMQML